MKLLTVTPLFPPDIADPAPYVKELATRLTTDYIVTVLAYGSHPEQIKDVTFISIPKRVSAAIRLGKCIFYLLKETKLHDKVLVQNGPSTELPAFIASLVYKEKMILMMSDQKVTYSGWRSKLHNYLRKRITTLEKDDLALPMTKPDIHPLKTYPTESMKIYEQSWESHVTLLNQYLS